MNEAEVQGKRAVRKLLFPDSLDEEVDAALNRFQALFHLSRVSRNRRGQYNGMELCAFHAGCLQQPAVLFVQGVAILR